MLMYVGCLVLYIYGGCRKLAELGFKRSPVKCKEKFEEESRYFNNNINYKKNYNMVFSELEGLYNNHGDHHHHHPQQQESTQEVAAAAHVKDTGMDKKTRGEQDKIVQNLQENPTIDDHHQTTGNYPSDDNNERGNVVVEKSKSKKRKRSQIKKFEMFKSFWEEIVHKLLAQQEEMHNRLLEDMVKRDEEKVAREKAWKKQEVDRFNKELELRAYEQALASDRQATLIKFLKQFTSFSNSGSSLEDLGGRSSSAQDLGRVKPPNGSSSHPSTSSPSLVISQNTNDPTQTGNPNTSPVLPTSLIENFEEPQNPRDATLVPSVPKLPASTTLATPPQNPNSLTTQNNSLGSNSFSILNKVHTRSTPTNDKEDIGKRWPRDEVVALINLRSSLFNNNNNNGDQDKEGVGAKAPLWERISQGMLELGYKRSAKRCKEKWENINKYFRKTKDVNKKRSIDSRVCPYFHQLTTLYNQGRLMAPASDVLPENHSASPVTGNNTSHSISQKGSGGDSTMHGGGGESNAIQVAAAFDFEF